MIARRTDPLRLVLSEFEDIVSRGLCALFADDPDLELVASDVGTDELEAMIAERKPDVAIINFGSLSSPQQLRVLQERSPSTRLLVLANHPTTAECQQLARFGAAACLTKGAGAHDLREAIYGGEVTNRGLTEAPGPVTLTEPEVNVLELLRSGRSNAEIAATLHVGFDTVRAHTSSIYSKLGVTCRRELRGPEFAHQVAP